MFKESPEGQTNSCNHENQNTSGVCDECLGVQKCLGCGRDLEKALECINDFTKKWDEYTYHSCKYCCPGFYISIG